MKNPTERLTEVFVSVLALPPATDPASIRRSSTASWDSLVQITLITAVETEFGVMFDADEYAAMTSFESVAGLLGKKGLL